ncbi:MAG: hypothetical protein JWO88_275 [Frankiales bacterium]|nr:hypothetical protein [Frankiales bacterium]
MKLKLRHKLPAVIGAALVITGASGAAAFALVATHSDDSTGAGNSLPIDDNHRSLTNVQATPRTTPEPGDDNGVDQPSPSGSASADDRGVHASAEPGDDRGLHASAEPGDDRGGSSSRGSDDATASHSPSARSGSDDATPEPTQTADDHGGATRSGSSGSGSSGSGSSGSGSSGSGSSGSGSSGSDDGGGHGSDG